MSKEGHVMNEVEKLRGLLTRCDEYLAEKGVIRDAKLRREIRAALSKQAEPAPALDEREAFEGWADQQWPGAKRQQLERDEYGQYKNTIYRDYWTGWQARATRPVQTEQQPDVKSGNPDSWSVTTGGTGSDMEYVVVRRSLLEAIAACEWRGEMAASSGNELRAVMAGRVSYGLYPAPIAQTEQQLERSELADTLLRQVELRNEVICELYAEFSRGGTPNWEPIFERARKLVVYALPEPARSFALSKSASPQPEQSGLASAVRDYLDAIDNGSDEYDVKRARAGVRHALSAQGTSK